MTTRPCQLTWCCPDTSAVSPKWFFVSDYHVTHGGELIQLSAAPATAYKVLVVSKSLACKVNIYYQYRK